MADLPFKINIETEAGKQYSYFDADFADTTDANISASVMLTRVNALASQSYSSDEAAGGAHSGGHLFNNGYNDWIAASVVGSVISGSLKFEHTDTLDSSDRLKRYRFFGTKVCNVLGFPAGQWEYPVNFQLDDTGTGTNYFSGDISADNLSVAEKISFSPISDIAGNIRFNIDKSVDKFIQFTSGSGFNQENKLIMGYNTDDDKYVLEGLNVCSASYISSYDIKAFNIRSTTTMNDLNLIAGRTSFSPTDTSSGQIYLDWDGIYSIAMGKFQYVYNESEAWDGDDSNSINSSDFGMVVHNNDAALVNRFSGIGFQMGGEIFNAGAGTQTDNNTPMGAITVHRASSTLANRTSRMNFSLNDGTDDASVSGNLQSHLTIQYDGDVGIATQTPSYKLHVVGDIGATANITAYASDIRLKENVKTIEGPLEKVLGLEGVTFNWNELAEKEAGFDREEGQVGLLAQDLQKILPEAVKLAPFDKAPDTGDSISGEKYLTIQYERVVPLLVESIKEMGSLIGDLESRIEQLEGKE